MQRIDNSAVRGWSSSGKIIKPSAISAVCPHCGKHVVFSFREMRGPGPQNSAAGSGICPACRQSVGFWCLNSSGGTSASHAEVFMHPSGTHHFPLPAELSGLPEPLRKALVATIDTYNAGVYAGAAVLGRRCLEGIFKYLVDESKRKLTLARLIDEAIATKDLAEPLRSLSHAIRSGGNLGAHFDEDREPDAVVARQMVELLVYLISYLYVLPERIEGLERELSKSPVKAGH